ncbi:glutamate-1-semialdehyde 2,1-aminomutase [Candidatus Latescibacterota bacterium]
MKSITFVKSRVLHERAGKIIVGGVNSPARAFKSVGGNPLFVKRSEGCHIWDADGNQYIDYIGSWGAMIAGHAHPDVISAVTDAATLGTSFGVSTESEIGLAEKIRAMMPSMEMLRMVNSGTEATMSAIRLARGYTSRSKIIKFAGCYHGHGDSFLIKSGSGALTLGVPDSAGVTPAVAGDTLVARFNNLDSVDYLLREYRKEIAAVIVEPVAGNMGTVPPSTGFLEGLRERTACEDIVLIFDEVMTGFRLARGGAQEMYRIQPDLTTLGKIVGGGMPVGVYGGKAEIMNELAPQGPVYQAGTLSGNPLAMAAGHANLTIVDNVASYIRLDRAGRKLEKGLTEAAAKAGVSVTINRVGSMITVFFTDSPVTDYESALKCDTQRFSRFFSGMLSRGILLPPSQFEAAFISLAHDDDALKTTIKAAEEAFKECK